MFGAIAFGGGGVRGGLHVGALQALEKVRGNLLFPQGIYGCSIGAIVATAVAFELKASQIQEMMLTYLNIDTLLPPLRLQHMKDIPVTKGLFPMTHVEKVLLDAFQSQGIDLRGKTIGDAPQPLHIFASNLTTHKGTMLTKKCPLLQSILCSCAIPILFQPQVLYNQVFVDGGLRMDVFHTMLPLETLFLNIDSPPPSIVSASLSMIDFSHYMFALYRNTRHSPTLSNVLFLRNKEIGLFQPLTDIQKQELIEQGYTQTLDFLAQRFSHKLDKTI